MCATRPGNRAFRRGPTSDEEERLPGAEAGGRLRVQEAARKGQLSGRERGEPNDCWMKRTAGAAKTPGRRRGTGRRYAQRAKSRTQRAVMVATGKTRERDIGI